MKEKGESKGRSGIDASIPPRRRGGFLSNGDLDKARGLEGLLFLDFSSIIDRLPVRTVLALGSIGGKPDGDA